MDAADVLAQLEAAGPTAGAPEVLPMDGPRTPREAMVRWLAARGVRPGLTPAPAPSALCCVFTAYARAQGWDMETPTPHAMGAAFRAAGMESSRLVDCGYLVTRESAAALWRDVGGRKPQRRAPTRVPAPRPKPRGPREPVRPIRTCDGRLWTQRGLAEALGVTTLAVSRAVHGGGTVRGLHARFATPAEVRLWRAQADDWDGGIGSPS